MRAVIQRVLSANASVDGEVISSIEKGLCILLGISRDDTKKDMEYLVRKILDLRLFEDEKEKRWSKSVRDSGLEVLCLSQITLYHTLKGNKPNFNTAMPPADSRLLFQDFVAEMRAQYRAELVKEGRFGAYLVVGIQNDGPVTIVLDSPRDPAKLRVDTTQGEEPA